MIVVDTSALLAILLGEREADRFEILLAEADARLPVSCYLEASLSLRRRRFPPAAIDRYLQETSVRFLIADERQARLAADADRRYGRATGHRARLNFGDCLAYAAAIANDAPLLFKGDDFGHTDVKCAS